MLKAKKTTSSTVMWNEKQQLIAKEYNYIGFMARIKDYAITWYSCCRW